MESIIKKLIDKIRAKDESEMPPELDWESMRSGIYSKMGEEKKRPFLFWINDENNKISFKKLMFIGVILLTGAIMLKNYAPNFKTNEITEKISSENSSDKLDSGNKVSEIQDSEINNNENNSLIETESNGNFKDESLATKIKQDKKQAIDSNTENKINSVSKSKLNSSTDKKSTNLRSKSEIASNNRHLNKKLTKDQLAVEQKKLNDISATSKQDEQKNATIDGNEILIKNNSLKGSNSKEKSIENSEEKIALNPADNNSSNMLSEKKNEQKSVFLTAPFAIESKISTITSELIIKENTIAKNLNPEEKKSKLKLGFYTGNSLVFVNRSPIYELPDDVHVNERQIAAPYAGISAGKKLKNGFMISTGIECQQFYTKFEYKSDRLVSQAIQDTVVRIVHNQITGREEFRRGDTTLFLRTKRNLIHTNSSTTFNVPLMLDWSNQNGRFNYGAGGGILFNLTSIHKGRTYDKYAQIENINIDRKQIKTQLGFAFSGRVNFGYQINSRINLSMHIAGVRYLNNWRQDEAALSYKPFLLRTGIGLEYEF